MTTRQDHRREVLTVRRILDLWAGLAWFEVLDLVIGVPIAILVDRSGRTIVSPVAVSRPLCAAGAIFVLIATLLGVFVMFRHDRPMQGLGLVVGYSLATLLSTGVYTALFFQPQSGQFGSLAPVLIYCLILFFLRAVSVLARFLATVIR